MIKVISIVVALALSPLSIAADISAEKKRAIDEMLALTGATKIGEMMGNAVANQMITVMAQQNKDIDPRITRILRDEVNKIMHDEFIANRFLNRMSYDIYDKYFTMAEIKAMNAFYKTPVGSKMASLMPQVTQEAMLAGQKHGQSLGPIIQQRLTARFAKEGIR